MRYFSKSWLGLGCTVASSLVSALAVLPLPGLTQLEPLLQVQGTLEAGDETLTDGSLYDRYEFEGRVGDVVTILLESEAFDTFLLLQDGQGNEVSQNDDISHTNRNSALVVTLPQDGLYQVLANTYDEQGQGPYKLIVTPIAPGQPNPFLNNEEVKNLEADRLLQQGILLYQANQYPQSIDFWQQALGIYQAINNRQGEATALGLLGDVYGSLYEYSQAIDAYNQALVIFQELGNLRFEAIGWDGLGEVYSSQGLYFEAIESYEKALPIYQEVDDLTSTGNSFLSIGNMYFLLGQYNQSRDNYIHAQAIFRETKDNQGQALAIMNLGNVHRSLGNYSHAIEDLSQALLIFQGIGDGNYEAAALNNIGIVYFLQGHYLQAINVHAQALEIFKEIGDHQGQYQTFNNLGNAYLHLAQYVESENNYAHAIINAQEIRDRHGEAISSMNIAGVYSKLGQYSLAIDLYIQSLETFQEIGSLNDEARAFSNLEIVYRSLGQYSQSIDALNQALEIFQVIGDRNSAARVLNNLGNIYHSQGNYSQALDAHSQAMNVFREIGDRQGEALALANLGNTSFSLDQIPQSREAYTQALTIAKEIGDRDGEARILENIGAVYQYQRHWSQAEEVLRDAVNVYRALRPQEMDAQDKLSLLDQQSKAYKALQEVLVAQNRPFEALEISEWGRTRALITTLVAKLPDEVQAKLNPEEPTLAEIKQIAAEQNATLVEYSIVDNPLTPDDAADQLILIWVVKPDRTITFASSPLPNRATLSALTNIFPQLSGTGEGAKGTTLDVTEIDQTLEQLYTLLIAPIADELPKTETERVIFIPHEELFRVPFAALRNPDTLDYLIQNHTILTAPSIQALSLTREHRNRVSTSSGALVVGDPAIAPDLMTAMNWERLRGTNTEVEAIATILGITALLQETATEATIRDLMPQARYIHLATHGALTPNAVTVEASAAETVANRAETDRLILERATYNQVPGFVALTPTPGTEASPGLDNPDDGILSANEIITMTVDKPLTADLVVLSACQTGTGPVTSDGVYGLSYAFITAGVPSLVVSLWNANDSGVTDHLMEDFYTNLTSGEHQGDKAQSLRQAMLQQLEDGNLNPAGWAAFTLIGEADSGWKGSELRSARRLLF